MGRVFFQTTSQSYPVINLSKRAFKSLPFCDQFIMFFIKSKGTPIHQKEITVNAQPKKAFRNLVTFFFFSFIQTPHSVPSLVFLWICPLINSTEPLPPLNMHLHCLITFLFWNQFIYTGWKGLKHKEYIKFILQRVTGSLMSETYRQLLWKINIITR